ncbi:hypothetical protein O6H91_13G039000 [Diphasiastrum complanatum]|uniref:Uncharacterized protein n=1 Tax=Diphasiastrum complanatum TaxID=34168 RepID=A0ACC2BV29_DIPCM|nr:hypothetical protein O6H91_13G039000 [Diphasiastrum complanatum]
MTRREVQCKQISWKLIPFILWHLTCFSLSASVSIAATSDMRLLLTFKENLVDDEGNLGNWRGSDSSPCNWNGVICNSTTKTVVGLNLTSQNLSGTISPVICKLRSLTFLVLKDNLFNENFPLSILNCPRLIHLDLSLNYFGGTLPDNISSLSSLQYLDLSYNSFSGFIPQNFGELSELQFLNFWNCRLSGHIPPQLGNLTKLTNLSLSYNNFSWGSLPCELRNLQKLQSLKCGGCNLTGSLPPWLGELKELDFLELTYNNLSGSIPPELMHLPKLTKLELYNNLLSGSIPREIGNLSSLTDLDLNSNLLTGPIPAEIGQLSNLGLLHLWNNSLSGQIPESLAYLQGLYDVALFLNELTGIIPQHLGDNCSLEIFDVSTNHLTGPIPPNLCNGGRLWRFILFNNNFSGIFPDSYGSCHSLIRFRIFSNSFSGVIPNGLWGSPLMTILDISNNLFEGAISSEVGKATSLQTLRLQDNNLNGTLPPEIGQLSLLNALSASRNKFSGVIPGELGNCSALTYLYLDSNSFIGQIPPSLGNLSRLVYLDLAKNALSGQIPSSFGSLQSLISLDLSVNQLSGRVPVELGKLKLTEFNLFNLSYNNLSGVLPFTVSSGNFGFSFAGNPGLCVPGVSASPSCSNGVILESIAKKTKHPGAMAWITGTILFAAVAISLVGSYCFYKRVKIFYMEKGLPEVIWTVIPFQKLNFREEEILESLDDDNVIGSGGAGTVYKATLQNGSSLAVKKLWSCPKGEINHDYGFKAEVETLGRIRHVNIVKLICCCSSGETNLLVYEYVPNGSLCDLLHGTKGNSLDWPIRHKIALGAAQGLAYLHHDCAPQILHRDIKSNNILLSSNYDALLADFGLAKLLESSSLEAGYSMSTLAGSHGYIAPEYAHGLKVTEKSDIYSFGVVLLELITSKRPVEPEFGEGVDLVKWVCRKIQTKEGVVAILDSKIPGARQQDMLLVLKLALRCTSVFPSTRPSMREVVDLLKQADPNRQSTDKGKAQTHSKA